MNSFRGSKGKQPMHHTKMHSHGHPTKIGRQRIEGTTSTTTSETSASSYGLSAGDSTAMAGPFGDDGLTPGVVTTHHLQHVNYNDVCDGGNNSAKGNAYLKSTNRDEK